MQTTLTRLRDKLGASTDYFRMVYNYTFDFSRAPGQRSLGARSPFPPSLSPLPICLG